jgi:hypothetical protein
MRKFSWPIGSRPKRATRQWTRKNPSGLSGLNISHPPGAEYQPQRQADYDTYPCTINHQLNNEHKIFLVTLLVRRMREFDVATGRPASFEAAMWRDNIEDIAGVLRS